MEATLTSLFEDQSEGGGQGRGEFFSLRPDQVGQEIADYVLDDFLRPLDNDEEEELE